MAENGDSIENAWVENFKDDPNITETEGFVPGACYASKYSFCEEHFYCNSE
jgi:hypothetical protein